ncbi:MAG: hypothetical protein GY814_19390 [Gammaproteobacteria bacterium]|nr:hypothetical protein [Gammaproteobacteria bacterium]
MKDSVLVEITCAENLASDEVLQMVRGLQIDGFTLDETYEPVFMHGNDPTNCKQTVIVRGWVDTEIVIILLQQQKDVANVWKDTTIAPMTPSF